MKTKSKLITCAKCDKPITVDLERPFGQQAYCAECGLNDYIPEGCYALLPSQQGGKVNPIMIKRYTKGYHTTNWLWSENWEAAEIAINELNSKLGISEAVMETMIACSMHGNWKAYPKILERITKLLEEKKA